MDCSFGRYNECVGENDEDADEESEELEDGEVQTVEKIKRMKEAELEVLRDWYLEACGTQLPWDADKTTGIPFIGTDKDKVPVRLARLLRDRRFISCCGPKAPPPAAADQTAAAEEEQQQQQQPKPGCQVSAGVSGCFGIRAACRPARTRQCLHCRFAVRCQRT